MNILQSIKSAFAGIRSNLLRSGLTALGIIIGVAAVIALLSVGHGAQADVVEQVNQLGTNTIMIFPTSGIRFERSHADMLKERVSSISAASAVLDYSTEVKWQNETHSGRIEGVGEGYLKLRNIEVVAGRSLRPEEFAGDVRVALVGQTVVEELFDGRWPVGESVYINDRTFTVVGVLEERGMMMAEDQDDVIIVPLGALQRASRRRRVSALYAEANSPEVAVLTTVHIQKIFDTEFSRDDSVRVMSQEQILDVVKSIIGVFTIMLGAIAAISLLVGGIGIMNIMLVSVKERTREIGIRKAVGAKRRDILVQFLIESIILSMGGGVLGILAGWGLSVVISAFGLTVAISASSVLLAFAFSAAVGLFFGVYPALQAARLDPINALRYE